MHREETEVDARLGKQEFSLKFWLDGNELSPGASLVPEPWTVRVILDGIPKMERKFLVIA